MCKSTRLERMKKVAGSIKERELEEKLEPHLMHMVREKLKMGNGYELNLGNGNLSNFKLKLMALTRKLNCLMAKYMRVQIKKKQKKKKKTMR